MVVNDVGKTVILVVAMIGVLGLVGIGRVTWSDVDWLVAGITGVFIGNGSVAARKRAPSPMIVAGLPDGGAIDATGASYTAETDAGQVTVIGPVDPKQTDPPADTPT